MMEENNEIKELKIHSCANGKLCEASYFYDDDTIVIFQKGMALGYLNCNDIPKKDKYKWHDLRKNQNDLPVADKNVVCACQFNNRYIYVTHWYHRGFWSESPSGKVAMDVDHIVAWKYIEPFEGGE